MAVQAQPVGASWVYGSYATPQGGIWRSGTASNLSTTVPDDSNLLLGFSITHGGVTRTFSTGVDDAALAARLAPLGLTYEPQVFRALPMPTVASPSSINTNVIGIASQWGGVNQAAAGAAGDVPSHPDRPMSYYLNDGQQGLELGTAVFNIPQGTVSTGNRVLAHIDGAHIDPSHIGDGIPDILVTQVGVPSTSSDTFAFLDNAGAVLGTAWRGNLGSFTPVGRQQWTFYNAATLVMAPDLYGPRDLRVIALDFADLGITTSNYMRIDEFRHTLSGQSDIAFIAYNATSFLVIPPELHLGKTGPASLALGGTGDYVLTLRNASTTVATSGTLTVTDTLPAGLVPTAAAGTGWTCALNAQAVTCTSVQSLAAGASAPPITVTVRADPGVAASVTNTASVSGGGDTGCPADTARCSASVTTAVALPQLALTKTVAPTPLVPGGQASFTLQVRNAGAAASLGTVTLTDTLPAGLVPTAASGTGWACTVSGQDVSCTTAAPLAAQADAPPVVITADVLPTAPVSLTNTARLSGGGDPACTAAAPCTASASATVPRPQLALQKTVSPTPLVRGGEAVYTLLVNNTAADAATFEPVTVTDTLPTGLTPTAANGSGWACTVAAPSVSCTHAAPLAAGASAAPIELRADVAADAPASLVNQASVSGGGDAGCPADARCQAQASASVVSGAAGSVAPVPALGLPGLLLTGLGVGLLGWWRRRR